MNVKIDPAIAATKVSFNAISEFLFACLNAGEENVIAALRSVRNRSAQSLKDFIINVTCQEFGESHHFINNVKIAKRTPDQNVCFAAIIFFIRKYQELSYREIIILLNLKKTSVTPKTLSTQILTISKLNESDDKNRRYCNYVNTIDQKIKTYIIDNFNITNNGKK
jgi:hypothetical protein